MHGLSFRWRRCSTRLALVVCLLLCGLANAAAAAPVAAPVAASVAASVAPVSRLRLLALGDSLTAGYGLAHEHSFTAVLQQALDSERLDVTVLDAGVSGDTSAGALARLDWALGDHPDAAIVELGGNDGLRGLPPDQMEHNIGAILDSLAARHIPALLSGMLAPPNMGASYGAEFAAVFGRLSRRPGLLYDPFFLQGVALHESLQQDDHIHPNARGVQVIVARMMPAIRALLASARRPG